MTAGRVQRAFLDLYARAGAHALSGFLQTLARSCRLELDRAHPFAGDSPVVLAYWHEWTIAGFLLMLASERPLASFCHPTWKLAPWVELGRQKRWRVVLGSTGHGGRDASDEIVRAVREGYCTFVCPDGPSGPPHVMRSGAVHIAAQSGAPIVPVQFECTRTVPLPNWDRMRLPLPGSTLRARIGAPIYVSPNGDAEIAAALEQVRSALG